MLKLVKSLFLASFLVPAISFADLIRTDLASNAYVSYAGYDWAWASPYNVQFYNCNFDLSTSFDFFDAVKSTTYDGSECGFGSNQLLAPEFHSGWGFFENVVDNQSNLTIDEFIASYDVYKGIYDLFTRDGDIITAFQYWNTANSLASRDGDMEFTSDWTGFARYYSGIVTNTPTLLAFSPLNQLNVNNNSDPFPLVNTVYVRKSQPVPEPSSITIIALGLLGLAGRKKFFK